MVAVVGFITSSTDVFSLVVAADEPSASTGWFAFLAGANAVIGELFVGVLADWVWWCTTRAGAGETTGSGGGSMSRACRGSGGKLGGGGGFNSSPLNSNNTCSNTESPNRPSVRLRIFS